MEYVSNGMLSDKINFMDAGLSKEQVQFYAAQLVLTLEYLSSVSVAHRDLKPGNIMIDQEQYIKLIDFGEAKVIEKEETFDDVKSVNSLKSRSSSNHSKFDTKSDNDSYFGRMFTRKETNVK